VLRLGEFGAPVGPAVEREQGEELTDVVARLRGVTHLDTAIDHVATPPPHSLPLQKSGLDEVGDDPLNGTLRDPDHLRDVTQPHVGVTRDAEQHLGVVRDEPPALFVIT